MQIKTVFFADFFLFMSAIQSLRHKFIGFMPRFVVPIHMEKSTERTVKPKTTIAYHFECVDVFSTIGRKEKLRFSFFCSVDAFPSMFRYGDGELNNRNLILMFVLFLLFFSLAMLFEWIAYENRLPKRNEIR